MLNAKGTCVITMLHRGLEVSPVGKSEITRTVVYGTRIEACPALFPFSPGGQRTHGRGTRSSYLLPSYFSALKVKAKSKKVNGYQGGILCSPCLSWLWPSSLPGQRIKAGGMFLGSLTKQMGKVYIQFFSDY